jgi:hypothetical protein
LAGAGKPVAVAGGVVNDGKAEGALAATAEGAAAAVTLLCCSPHPPCTAGFVPTSPADACSGFRQLLALNPVGCVAAVGTAAGF